MSRLLRRTRRADDWASPHERARTRAAQRLDWPLHPTEAAWLDTHLAACVSCRQMADDYAEIRTALRSLRDSTPPPPRDLWARTAAAIEQEARRSRGASSRRLPLGALSGALVIVVVLGATLLSNTPRPQPVIPPAASDDVIVAATDGPSSPNPAGTPLSVAAGPVDVIRRGADGSLGYGRLGVDEVCPKGADITCPTIRDAYATALAVEAQPQAIIGSPDDEQAVLVSGTDGSEANEVLVVALPKGSPVPTDSASATPSAEPSLTPDDSPLPSESAAVGSAEPSADPNASPSVASSASPAPSPTPDVEPSATPDATSEVTPTPTPESLAIASGLIVVGQTAAFSPDGEWFAFTARPADRDQGPDIYVWRAGSERAVPVTDDHRSVFASWTDGQLVGSAPGIGGDTSAGPVDVPPIAFLIDPTSGEQELLSEPAFRPVVSPDSSRALVFDGAVSFDDRGTDIVLGDGALELRTWSAREGAAADGATVVLDDVATPFDARWDDAGEAFAVWVQDAADPSFGRLSLYFVDPETGGLSQPDNAPRDEPALAGFSIGEGRLAWVTPAGQGGEGSRVQVVAWTDDGVGSAETAPGDQLVVIR